MIRSRRKGSGWAVAVLATLLATGSRGAAAETIRISGTGGAVGTIQILVEAFRKTNPGINVDLLPGMGSSGAIKAVLARRLDIGLSARPLSGQERARGIVETKYARTPFVFAANSNLKMDGLTLEGVAAIYAGKRYWENGKRIRPVLRPSDDSDMTVLRSMSPAVAEAVDAALKREGMIVASTSHDAADIIENVPGAFGATTLALVLSEKRLFRVLPLNGVTPSLRTLSDRSYPFSQTFFLVTVRNPAASVRRFIDFVRSPAGVAILAKNGQDVPWEEGVRP